MGVGVGFCDAVLVAGENTGENLGPPGFRDNPEVVDAHVHRQCTDDVLARFAGGAVEACHLVVADEHDRSSAVPDSGRRVRRW